MSDKSSTAKRKKNWLSIFLRSAVSTGILSFLFFKVDWTKITSVVERSNPIDIVLGIFFGGCQVFFSAVRWKILLQTQEIFIPMFKAFELTLIGQFFNAFLLGSTGGDIVRIYYIVKLYPEKKTAGSLSVIYDRVIGLVGLILIGQLLALNFFKLFEAHPITRHAVWLFFSISLFILFLFGLILFFPNIFSFDKRKKKTISLFSKQNLNNLIDAISRYRHGKKENFMALCYSVISHGSTLIMAYCATRSLHLDIPFLFLASILAIVSVLISIPVTISGLGVREGLIVVFFQLLGIKAEPALSFSLLVFAMSVFWSLVGGIVYLRYKKP
ncbi:flippase-like domain-containing protein [Methylacidiphilum caldifontis]|uniref:lysylphosphatidylglycerol synthase transmembrane domain-containing protein n=1 Tax=Methylacidiphilum caldifontis TaxID=2795386 RepID=UPI001A8C8C96|nr:lysylphosphatidylglycerol synthase transmembrane domain-containing protein [Methylacidiphilum caldifontis]QSR87840.1 flippase-like domain-containing protein [Methylacidiphilum caldifontis]